ncbi:1,4-beta-xylanase [Mycolicibacterium litorale]|uniref:1,4-beta-xylanase n=1 Tax=Mycolicibacterium litorale TaxID=758802 RepID=UPI0039A2B42D
MTATPEHPTRRTLGRRTALKLPALLTASAAASRLPRASADTGRWSAERAQSWYRAQGWLVGANYIPSNAVNQFEMFQAATFDRRRIDSELLLARRMGLNTVRVFLHDQLWAQDRNGFARRLGQFVTIAARHGIRPLFVLFDSCWDPLPKAGRQQPPRPGVHNSRWVQSPGAHLISDTRYRHVLRDYVTGVLRQFRNDERVLGWDLWNEPDNPAKQYRDVERKDKYDRVAELLPQVFRWAREVAPVQPLTSGVWDGEWADPARRGPIVRTQLDHSDIVTFHNYGDPEEFDARITELVPLKRPIVCTEFLAREFGSTIEGVLPVARRRNVGVYTWGLMSGRTQTHLPWDSWDEPYTSPPDVWFHDLLRPDGQPYRDTEVRTIRSLTGRGGPA